jgi:rhodanese-related sulfurtransferase
MSLLVYVASTGRARYDAPVKIVIQLVALGTAGALVGLGANALSPRPAPLGQAVRPASETTPGTCAVEADVGAGGVPRISVEQAAPLCADCSAAFVDARTAEQYQAGHVSGALHLPPGDVPPEVLESLKKFKTTVVYDDDASCILADAVAMGLREMGLSDVRVLTGSWPAWAAAGAPGASGPCGACSDGGRH